MNRAQQVPQLRHSFLWQDPLRELAQFCWGPRQKIVEIGSFAGESTLIFLQCAIHVDAIDPWTDESLQTLYNGSYSYDGWTCDFPMERVEDQFDERVLGWSSLQKIKAYDHEVYSDYEDGSLDGIYIDSVHTYDAVCGTIDRWRWKVKPGGWIAGHDYSTDFPGVVAAVDEKLGEPQKTFADTSWAVRRKR